jgi:hypothetical protein
MASLTEVYDGYLRTVTTPRRLSLGGSLFALGAAMVVGSIVVATTGVGAQFGLELIEARRLAGILAGLGLPAAFLGVFTVLPAGPTSRGAAAIGASVAVLGVALFGVAYPARWFGAGDPLAAVTVVVYGAGALTTLGCLFAGLATFKTRVDPGGTARMEITEEGGVRLVEGLAGSTPTATASEGSTPASAAGSVGLFGQDPSGAVQTQTNRESPSGPEDDEDDDAEILGRESQSGSRTRESSHTHPAQRSATADGGSAVQDGSGEFTDAEFVEAAQERGRPDAYCGNCAHFEYVKVDGKITPYCGLHDGLMEDMDACAEWTDAD